MSDQHIIVNCPNCPKRIRIPKTQDILIVRCTSCGKSFEIQGTVATTASIPDYYSILGVSPDSDFSALKQAFKHKAGEAHPDHGGTHEAMVTLNEAWSILSDPATRERYDATRKSPNNRDIYESSATDQKEAKERSANYKKNWNEFSQWLDEIGKDFADAKYSGDINEFPFSFPTSQNSDSAILFIIIGFLIGLIPSFFLGAEMLRGKIQFTDRNPMGQIIFCMIVSPIAGAWAGRYVHPVIGSLFKQPPEQSDKE